MRDEPAQRAVGGAAPSDPGRLPRRPRGPDAREVRRSPHRRGVELGEASLRWCRAVEGLRRPQAPGADVEPAGGVGCDVPLQLRHRALPVLRTARVALGDADGRPVDRDLRGPPRVGAQRPSAHLHGRLVRGRRGEVDDPGDAPRVPALAEHAAGADEHLRAPRGEVGGHLPDPAVRLPGQGPVGEAHPLQPRERHPAGLGARERHRHDAERRPQAGVPLGHERREVRHRAGGAGDGPARHQHGVEQVGRGVVGELVEHRPRGPRLAVDGAAHRHRHRRRRALVVGEHEHPHPRTEHTGRVVEDLDAGHRLRLRAREHTVGHLPAPPHAVARPDPADRRQGAAQDRERLGVPGVLARRHAATEPVVDEEHPVLQGRRHAVLPPQARTARQAGLARVGVPQEGVRDGRVGRGEGRPRHPAPPGAGGGHEAQAQPLAQRRAPEPRGVEQCRQLGEAQRRLPHPRDLGRRRRREPGELGVGREVALPHQVHGARLVGRRPEVRRQRPALLPADPAARRAGERHHAGVAQVGEGLDQQRAPGLEQVVRLVEEHQQGAQLGQARDQVAAVLVEPGTDLRVGDAVDLLGQLERVALGVDGRVGGRFLGRRHQVRHGLEREHRDLGGEGPVGGGLQPQVGRRGDPLPLDGGRRHEHDHRRAARLPGQAGEPEADVGLPRSRWHDHPGAERHPVDPLAALVGLHRGERRPLVRPPRQAGRTPLTPRRHGRRRPARGAWCGGGR